ncbi:hypothetical protein F5050DRAFT_1811719 [Lentinula boryana]|uniref:RING-type domain-containing protein n=1 Tax=Lentinula boryana TaxID=40481 RepID=A0ABQ8Q0L4_9AGAR|nr:hypothetical protein F5050DRAFT_1811719 [Lentinula boryana]
MPSTRTLATKRAASPYPIATSGSSDTSDEVKTTRRRPKPTVGSRRPQAEVNFPTREEFENMKQRALAAHEKLFSYIAEQKLPFTCSSCKGLAFYPQISDCGHIHCSQCIYASRKSTVDNGDISRCAVCRELLLWAPNSCYALQEYIHSLAKAEGTTVPNPLAVVWTPRP